MRTKKSELIGNIISLVTLLLLVACTRQPGEPIENDHRRLTSNPHVAGQDSPTAALRKFLIAIVTADKEALTAVVLPHPEIDLLLRKDKLSFDNEEFLRDVMSDILIVEVKLGDEMQLRSGERVLADALYVNSERQQLKIANEEVVFDMVLIDGNWKVNAELLVAERKNNSDVVNPKDEAKAKE